MPLNVAATSVKLAMPPPITRARFWPSGSAVAHCRETLTLFVEAKENISWRSLWCIMKMGWLRFQEKLGGHTWRLCLKYLKFQYFDDKKEDEPLHQLQPWHIARLPLHWVLHCIQHSFQVQKHSQDLQPDEIVIISLWQIMGKNHESSQIQWKLSPETLPCLHR